MTLTEPTSVLFETGVLASFEKADGSGDPVEVRGLLENAETERATGETRRKQDAWEFTGPVSEIGSFVETDEVTIGATEYTIIDEVARDESQITFLLSVN